MNRYYLPAGAWTDDVIGLTGDEAKHCARVMRAREGDDIEIFNGVGTSAVCRIESITRDLVQCLILQQQSHPQTNHPITLCQAVPKGGNMELIIQKSVELGVSAIQPIITTHTIARVARPGSTGSAEKKQTKWQRIALEACKQCGQNHLPEIHSPITFDQWIKQAPGYGTSLVAALDKKAVHLKSHFASSPPTGSIALLVGPEGDLSPEEYQAAYASGFQPISFGAIVMRVETASLYGLSILQHELSAT